MRGRPALGGRPLRLLGLRPLSGRRVTGRLLALGLCVFASLLAGLCASRAEADGADALSVELQPIRVGAHSWYVRGQSGMASALNEGFNSNAGFVVTPDGIVVIDALGTPALGRALLAAIRRISDRPIRRLILTHYHADHFYGAQAFRDAGAEVWAQAEARDYVDSPEAAQRLAQRREDLAPWVDASTTLLRADRWIGEDQHFTLGGVRFELMHFGPAHSPEDLVISVVGDGVVYSGDLLFAGRIPFLGSADARRWLAAIDRLLARRPSVMVPGHGEASRAPARELRLTRDYLRFLRAQMAGAVASMTDFDHAYAAVDWSRWAAWPAFEDANRSNAYNVYLQLEQESLGAEPKARR